MKELAKGLAYIALTVWAQNGGPIDQELIDLIFGVWDILDMVDRDDQR